MAFRRNFQPSFTVMSGLRLDTVRESALISQDPRRRIRFLRPQVYPQDIFTCFVSIRVTASSDDAAPCEEYRSTSSTVLARRLVGRPFPV